MYVCYRLTLAHVYVLLSYILPCACVRYPHIRSFMWYCSLIFAHVYAAALHSLTCMSCSLTFALLCMLQPHIRSCVLHSFTFASKSSHYTVRHLVMNLDHNIAHIPLCCFVHKRSESPPTSLHITVMQCVPLSSRRCLCFIRIWKFY
jgi:hypothetical protein